MVSVLVDRRLCRVLAAIMMIALFLAPDRGSAQSVERARTLYLGADFEAARREARAILSSETASRADAVEALRILVALESMLGTPEDLRAAARSLVLLEPSATPADGAPETAAAALETARAEPAPSVTVVVTESTASATAQNVPSIASALALSCTTPSGTRGAVDPGSQQVSLELEEAGLARCTAELRTARGTVLASSEAETGETQTGGAPTGGGAPGGRQRDGGDDLPWILVGVGAGVLTIAIVIGAVVAAGGSGDPLFAAPIVIGW